MAQSEIFLEIEGVAGESNTKGFEGKIDIQSFGFNANNPSSIGLSTSGGSGSGKVSISTISLSKVIDKSSPTLFLTCCQGKHFASAKLTVREAGGDKPVSYLIVKLKQVFVDYISWSAGQSGKVSESVNLSFAAIHFEYTPQKADGSADTAVKHGWNVKTNAGETW